MKKSIFRQSIIIGIIAIVFFSVAIVSFTAYSSRESMLDASASTAKKSADVIQSGYLGMEKNLGTFNYYSPYLEELRLLAYRVAFLYDIKYYYIYQPVEDGAKRRYIIAVSPDVEENVKIQQERSFGTIVDRELRSVERDVLNGVQDDHIEFTNNQYGSVYTWYFPIKNSEGEIVALSAIDFDATDFNATLYKRIVSMILPLILIMVAVMVIILWLESRLVFRPIKKLADKMDNYDPNAKIDLSDIKAEGEIRNITNAFANMSRDISEYIERNKVLIAERTQVDVELDIANKIQYGMVPQNYSFDGENYRVEAYAKAAKEVGGDFYAHFEEGRTVYFIVGDVSGKGIAAALFMSMILNIIREKLKSGVDLADALVDTNETIIKENPEGLFATVFVAAFDNYTGELRFANAGHTRPVFVSDENRLITPDPGMALGMFDDIEIENEFVILNDNEGLVFYSDGVTDAVNKDGEFFSEARIPEVIKRENGAGNTEVLAGAIREFVDGYEQFDDITIVTMFKSADIRNFKAEYEPDIDKFDEIRDEIFDMLGINARSKKILLACEEAFANIVNYSGTDKIGVILAVSEKYFVIRYEDSGIRFDRISDHKESKDFDELDTGGMGIRMVLQTATKAEYHRASGRNVFTLTFALE